MVCFAGHTDVVPTGNLDEWTSDPFIPTKTLEGSLRGRGAADMKSSLAAMIVACEEFLHGTPKPAGRIIFLLTSDEEGPATDGTVAVVEELARRQAQSGRLEIDYCIIGEPSSKRLTRRRCSGWTAWIAQCNDHSPRNTRSRRLPRIVDNPIHASRLIGSLASTDWDGEANDYFPPTSFQVSNISAGTGVTNMVPGSASFRYNWRFSTSTSANKSSRWWSNSLRI